MLITTRNGKHCRERSQVEAGSRLDNETEGNEQSGRPAWFQGFADEARWRFAKTYVESYPHEYTLRRWCEADDFWKAIRCIERWSEVESFWGTERKYLYDGDRKYWHMGDAESDDPKQRPGLINRTWLAVSRYREQARSLGYDGPELDALTERWNLLLARAKGGGQ